MSAITETLPSSDLTTLAGLQFFARQVVDGLAGGLHQSPHKGYSSEFKQHRQYIAGDEIRFLDWKVYAKSDRYFIREFEEETSLRATLLLDCSGSMSYGSESGDDTKHKYAVRLAACMAHLLIKQQDSVGLVSFDEHVQGFVPARSRPGHLRILMEKMATAEIGGDAELSGVLPEIVNRIPRRGLIVLISDCFGEVSPLFNALSRLRHAKHEIIVFQVWHRDELEFPFQQWTRFNDLEQDGQHQLVDPAHVRRVYMENLERFQDEIQQACNRNRIDLVPVVTDEPHADVLAKYLAMRRFRR